MYITKYKLHLQDRQDGARKLAKLVRGIQLYVSRGVLWGSSGGGVRVGILFRLCGGQLGQRTDST